MCGIATLATNVAAPRIAPRGHSVRLVRCSSIVAATVVLIASSSASEASADTPSLSPVAIFSRARDAATRDACSQRFEYEIVVTASANGAALERHYRARYSGDPKHLHVNRFSDEELAQPTVPNGTNVAITFLAGTGGGGNERTGLSGLSRTLTKRVDHDAPDFDILGVPELEPFYAFGLRRASISAAVPDDGPSLPTLRTIGKTSATRRAYAVELMDTEPLNGTNAYHLQLAPLREPTRYRLRDVWVDRESFGVLQVRTDGNFLSGPPTRSPWLTTYRRATNGCRYIARETASIPLDYGRDRRYERTTIAFQPIADPGAYRVPELYVELPNDANELTEPPE